MTEPILTEGHDGLTINVYQDDDPPNPRTDWDNLGTMTCFHGRYNLGDKHTMSMDELKELVAREDILSLPLYLFDHSHLTMRTSSGSFRAALSKAKGGAA